MYVENNLIFQLSFYNHKVQKVNTCKTENSYMQQISHLKQKSAKSFP